MGCFGTRASALGKAPTNAQGLPGAAFPRLRYTFHDIPSPLTSCAPRTSPAFPPRQEQAVSHRCGHHNTLEGQSGAATSTPHRYRPPPSLHDAAASCHRDGAWGEAPSRPQPPAGGTGGGGAPAGRGTAGSGKIMGLWGGPGGRWQMMCGFGGSGSGAPPRALHPGPRAFMPPMPCHIATGVPTVLLQGRLNPGRWRQGGGDGGPRRRGVGRGGRAGTTAGVGTGGATAGAAWSG